MERYFALLHGKNSTVEIPSGLFKETETETEYRLEYWSADGKWVLDYELARYLFGGEEGAELVTREQAIEIAKRLTDHGTRS